MEVKMVSATAASAPVDVPGAVLPKVPFPLSSLIHLTEHLIQAEATPKKAPAKAVGAKPKAAPPKPAPGRAAPSATRATAATRTTAARTTASSRPAPPGSEPQWTKGLD